MRLFVCIDFVLHTSVFRMRMLAWSIDLWCYC